VSTFRAVTVAPTTLAFCSSTTLPAMLPVDCCAVADAAHTRIPISKELSVTARRVTRSPMVIGDWAVLTYMVALESRITSAECSR
jgi:hypothetical protein